MCIRDRAWAGPSPHHSLGLSACLDANVRDPARDRAPCTQLYLDPFEWIIAYNLGLVHLNTGQNASAFHFFSASINLKSDFPASYMYLAISLARLDDFENSCSAYEKAMGMEEDHMTHLNFAITLYNFGEVSRAKEEFAHFQRMFAACGSDVEHDEDVISQSNALRKVRVRARARAPSYSPRGLARHVSLSNSPPRARSWGHSCPARRAAPQWEFRPVLECAPELSFVA